jgi:MacB-like periplasmic core domain
VPDWRPEIRRRLARLPLAPTREAEIVEELAQHLDDCYAESLARGATPAEAHRAALAELSGCELLARELRRVEQQVAPEPLVLGHNTRIGLLADLWQDLRFGARMLMKQPGFTLIVVVALALGIGANSTIFSFFNGVLLRPLPFRQPERLVILDEVATKRGGVSLGVSFSNFLDWREQNQVFSDVGGYHSITFTLTGAGDAEELSGAMSSHGLFKLLGVAPQLGRTFTPEEDQPGRGRVVMLGHGVWQRRFAGDPKIVGRTVTLVNRAWEVVGVMPPDFKFPAGAEFWIPLTLDTRG